MISPQNGDTLTITHFKGDQKRYSFNRIIATINIISHKQVVCIWTLPSNAEKLCKIMELPMNITTDCNRTFYRLDIALFHQNLLCLVTQDPDLLFGQGFALHELSNLFIEISM
ncbi:hypothetical protein P8452_52461 [Trifolium repens]|nr:hypothetical protein P8452_52461 [Trifolium repens]